MHSSSNLELLYEGDIVRSVAKELGIEEAKVEYHLTFMKDFINDIVSGEEYHSLHIPHLGIMYRNVKGCAYQNTKMGFMERTPSRQEKFDKNLRIITDMLARLRKFRNLSLHNRRRRIHNSYFTCIKRKRELELFQNKD